MSFGQPLWFWAFALLPLLLATFFHNEGQRRKQLRKLVAARLVDRLAGSVSVGKRRLQFFTMLLGLACVIASLAQPRLGYTWETTKRKGRDVLIAIDTSRSMLANDLLPNRLTRARMAAQDLIAETAGDRVGLIAFAGTAFLQAPLTVDYTAVLGALEELDTEIIPAGGTNIAEAIRAATEAFGKGESEHRALVIFTDGEELDADGVKAAEALNGKVRIFTVGLGSADGALIPLPSEGGGTEFVKDGSGKIVKSRLDETRLRSIAEGTGGFYVHLQNGRPEMKRIADDGLDTMSEKEIDARLSRQPIERYQWPLGAGLLLLAGSMLIGERKRVAARKSAPKAVAALALMALVPFTASAKNRGVEAYGRGDYKGAIEQFQSQLQRQPNSPALHFNLGSAAYQAGSYDQALEAFSKAVTSPEPGLRASAEYNLGNTLYQRGAAQKEKAPKLQEWKNSLQHYDEALKVQPKNADAEHNRDLVRRMIEELEKEPPKSEQEKKDQKDKDDKKKKDEKEQEKDKQDSGKDEKKDKGEQEKHDQKPGEKPGDEEEKKPGEGEKQEPGEKGKEGEQKEKEDGKKGEDSAKQPGNDKEGEENKPEPMPGKEGEKKEGELKSAQGEPKPEEDPQAEEEAEAMAAAEGRMTEKQAEGLLESLRNEDERVQLTDPKERKNPRGVFRDW